MSDGKRQTLVAVVLEADDWSHVEPLLAQESDTEVKVNIGRQRFPNERARRLCVLVRDGRIVGMCLARYLTRSGDVDYMAGIEYLRKLTPPEPIGTFVRRVAGGVRGEVTERLSNGGSFDGVLATEVEDGLRSDLVRAAVVNFLLARLDDVTDVSTHVARLRAEQRDALALALEVAGFTSRDVLRPSDRAQPPSGADSEPYLEGLPEERSGERAIIHHDSRNLDGWVEVATTLKTVTFADPKTGTDRITVTYADSTDLEFVTGTDLIYRRTTEPGYALVQYKQMTEENGRDVYRPDDQLFKEIARMRELSTDGASWFGNLHDYRLSAEPFYLKIVDSKIHRIENHKLADGMYFPLSLFEMMLADDRFNGPLGGWRITPRNAPKHLRNDLFIQMLQGGWIGTVGSASEDMTRMIRERLAARRGVILAEHHAEPRALQRAKYWE